MSLTYTEFDPQFSLSFDVTTEPNALTLTIPLVVSLRDYPLVETFVEFIVTIEPMPSVFVPPLPEPEVEAEAVKDTQESEVVK